MISTRPLAPGVRTATLLAAAAAVLAPSLTAQKSETPKDDSQIKPYDEVVTDRFTSQNGLVRVHRNDKGRLLYEIPQDVLGKELLLVSQIAGTQSGFSYAGMPIGDRVVRFERAGERVLLRDIKYDIRAEGEDSIARAVEATSIPAVIKTFDVLAWGRDQAPVIDVTPLFTGDVEELSAKRALGAKGLDKDRTMLHEVKAFETNVEVDVLATYKLGEPSGRGGRRDRSQSGVTALVSHSMIALPDNPMTPRVHDERVGYFTVGFEDYSDDSEQIVRDKRFITRWRLEKKDPTAEVSDPVKPIVFYVAREVPEKWKPYVKKGIDAWKPAFEAAGFSNAIRGEYAPSEREDPNWDPEDARISSIRWLPSSTRNAFGPHVHDPRTGEILEADVRMYHNVIALVRDWYFAQCGATDPRAASLPLPDDLLGELVAFVVTHEVGHSLGLPHNMKASSHYTIEQLRDPEWTKNNGTAPTCMDYARFNYVAQPGDGAALMPRIGPYDVFSIQWGYQIHDDENAGRRTLLARQIDNPILRFGSGDPSEDPTRQTEDLSNDPIAATTLGLKNLERIAARLVEATCAEGRDYQLLEEAHAALLGQWSREMNHVASIVGGVEKINLFHGDATQRYFPVDSQKQREAVAFLVDHAFATPTMFLRPDVLRRLEADGAANRILGAQSRVLRSLLSEGRVKRMSELVELGDDAFTPAGLMKQLRDGIWTEFRTHPVRVDLWRRNLQRAHLDLLAGTQDDPANDSDLPGLARVELEELHTTLVDAVGDPEDAATRAHITDLMARAEAALTLTRQTLNYRTAEASARRNDVTDAFRCRCPWHAPR